MSDQDSKDVPTVPDGLSKPDGFGTTASVAEACKRAHEAGSQIVADLGPVIGPTERRRILVAFRRELFPPGRPGRRRKETITAAHRDWKNGMRGPALYRTHIPGWEKHNRYRRQSEARALMDAVRTRNRREQNRHLNDKAKGVLKT